MSSMLPKKDFIVFYRRLKDNEIKEFSSIVSIDIGTKNIKIKSYSDMEELVVDKDSFIKLYIIKGKDVEIIEGVLEDKIEMISIDNINTFIYILNRLP